MFVEMGSLKDQKNAIVDLQRYKFLVFDNYTVQFHLSFSASYTLTCISTLMISFFRCVRKRTSVVNQINAS